MVPNSWDNHCGEIVRRICQILTVRMTTPGIVGAAAQRQGWSKIARRNHCAEIYKPVLYFEQAAVNDRQAGRMGVT